MLILKSYSKTLLASLLAVFVANGSNPFTISATDAKQWITAALAATLPLLITAIDPTDHRWGVKK